MIYLGKNIKSTNEILMPVSLDKVYRALTNKNGEVAITLKRLQAIRLIDENQYRKLKTTLPYLVCANFHPKIRKKENFINTERFIVDIDHISEFELDIRQVIEKFKADSRSELIFKSPSGDGLKIIFKLKEKISDTGYYGMFYKAFCLKLSEQMQLEGAIDTRTNDVSRCCFVSYDPDAFYNPNADPVDPSLFLPEEGSPEMDIFSSSLKKQEKEIDIIKEEANIPIKLSQELDIDVLNKIKSKIGMRVTKKPEKSYIQPEELEKITPEITTVLDNVGITVVSMKRIHYGRQIKVGAGKYWAEINLFYGQKGIKIVGTTKTGSNKELCESVVLLLKEHFHI